MIVGDIQKALGVPASTLSHHLAKLARVGLVLQGRRGREICCGVDYDEMRSLIGFLTEESCTGVTLESEGSGCRLSERSEDHVGYIPSSKNAAGWGRRIEGLIAVLAIFLGLVVFAPEQATASFTFVAEALTGMAVFLAAAIVIAAYARASGADNLIARAFEGRLSMMIVVAAIFGGLSPFCSCGVIPLIAALLAMGVPVPAVMQPSGSPLP